MVTQIPGEGADVGLMNSQFVINYEEEEEEDLDEILGLFE